MRLGSIESANKQIELGQRLVAEKQACVTTGGVWRTYVKKAFGLSRERADELIRIGAGLITVDEIRAYKANRQRASRRRRSQINLPASEFYKYAGLSKTHCNMAFNTLFSEDLAVEDRIEMRKVVVDAIFQWQKFFDVLDITSFAG